MLAALKDILHGILAPSLYIGLWVTIFAAIVRRAEWALYLLLILTPLPVVWYLLHPFPLGTSTLDLLVLAVTLGIFINKQGFEFNATTVVLIVFIIINYLALWNATIHFNLPIPFTTANPLLSDWKNYIEMIYLYWVAYAIGRDENQQKTLVVIMATVILLIMVREVRGFTEGSSFSYDKRAAGPFWIVGLGANHFAAFIAHYSGLLFGLFLVDKHKYRKWLYLGAVVASIYPLFFAYSRGAYIAALMVMLVYGVLKKRLLLVGLIALGLTWQEVLPPTVVERITMSETESGQIEESAAHRLVLWEHAKTAFSENMVFGVGFNSFGFTVPRGELTDTHNFYMKTAAEQGVIGLVIFTLVMLRALLSGWSLFRSGVSQFHQGLGLGFIGCVFAIAVTNVFGDRWSYFMLGSYFWVFWGLVDRAVRIAREPTPETPAPVPPATAT